MDNGNINELLVVLFNIYRMRCDNDSFGNIPIKMDINEIMTLALQMLFKLIYRRWNSFSENNQLSLDTLVLLCVPDYPIAEFFERRIIEKADPSKEVP